MTGEHSDSGRQLLVEIIREATRADVEHTRELAGLRGDISRLVQTIVSMSKEMARCNTVALERARVDDEAVRARQDRATRVSTTVRDVLKSQAGGIVLLVAIVVLAKACGVEVSVPGVTVEPPTEAAYETPEY